MPQCPFCQHEISEADVRAGRCLGCGRGPTASEAAESPPPESPLPATDRNAKEDTNATAQDLGQSTLACLHQAHDIAGDVTLKQPSVASWDASADDTRHLTGRETGGRYAVTGEMARGGMGAILRGLDQDLRRHVALKIMLEGDRVSAEDIERFVEEAQITGQLEHPNIVPVHELGVSAEGRVFFTMKMVRGRSLRKVLSALSDRPSEAEAFPLNRLLEIFLKVCDGVAFAHARGVIHRDLKPANIMIGEFGEVLVMDWGLAKLEGRDDTRHDDLVRTLRQEKGLTQTLDGMVAGTPSYMPPEQARGDVSDIDQRSDVYSLGAVLYEMLTLLPPVRGRTAAEILYNVIEGELAPPHEATPDRRIPPELSAICLKAMARNQRDRYAQVMDLAQDVRLFLEGRTVSAKPDTLLDRAVKLIKRNRQASLVTAAAALVLLAMGIVSYVNVRAERDAAVVARQAEARARLRAEQAAYAANIGLAEAKISQQAFDPARRLLDTCPAFLRHWEWGYLRHRCQEDDITLQRHSSLVRDAVLSQDGRTAVTVGDNAEVRVWQLPSGQRAARLPNLPETIYQTAALSTNGRYLLINGAGDARFFDLKQRALLAVLKTNAWVKQVGLTDDGKRGLTLDQNNEIRVWDLPRGTLVRTVQPPPRRSHVAAFLSANGQRLVAVGYGSARCLAVARGEALQTLAKTNGFVWRAAASPDLRRVVLYLQHQQELLLWETTTNRTRRYSTKDLGKITALGLTGDGEQIAVGLTDGRVLLLAAATGKPWRTLTGHSGEIFSVYFSRTGEQVITGSRDGTAKIWRVHAPQAARILRAACNTGIRHACFAPDNQTIICAVVLEGIAIYNRASGLQDSLIEAEKRCIVQDLAVAPDGKAVATAYNNGSVVLRASASGALLWRAAAHAPEAHSVDFSPDGTALATAGGRDRTVKLWDAATGKLLSTFAMGRQWAMFARFSPAGDRLLVGVGKDVVILDANTGQPAARFGGHANTVWAAAWSADGRWVFTASQDQEVRMFDSRTGALQRKLMGHNGPVHAVAVSRDGRRVLTGSADQTIKLWDTDTGNELLSLHEHTAAVYAVAFSPDGCTVMSAGEDGRLILYDAANWLTGQKPGPAEAADEGAF